MTDQYQPAPPPEGVSRREFKRRKINPTAPALNDTSSSGTPASPASATSTVDITAEQVVTKLRVAREKMLDAQVHVGSLKEGKRATTLRQLLQEQDSLRADLDTARRESQSYEDAVVALSDVKVNGRVLEVRNPVGAAALEKKDAVTTAREVNGIIGSYDPSYAKTISGLGGVHAKAADFVAREGRRMAKAQEVLAEKPLPETLSIEAALKEADSQYANHDPK